MENLELSQEKKAQEYYDKVRITGVMIQYYKFCIRRLWFFAHQINMNYSDENIAIGKLIHEESFERERKNINLGEVSFDFVRTGDDYAIFEIKKSSSLVEPAKYQLYYYLWYAKKLGKELKGVLVYPKEKRREEIVLTPEIEKEIEEIREDIQRIVALPVPPPPVIRAYCKKCSYFELCMV